MYPTEQPARLGDRLQGTELPDISGLGNPPGITHDALEKPAQVDDIILLCRVLEKIDNPRYGWTLILFMMGYNQSQISRIHGLTESTISRFDKPAIKRAYFEVKKDT